jgi:ribonuclease P/MRP protein subunit RPP40
MGVKGRVLAWLSDYLSHRKQRVIFNSKHSKWDSIGSGVPQGSILGPILFLIYINDIVNEISSIIKLFADDTTLYLEVGNPNNAADTLNQDLTIINAWACQWLVKFNPDKTETMTISKKKK